MTTNKKPRTFARAGAGAKGAGKPKPTLELEPGALVQFYEDGLRAGHILDVTESTVRVQPIGAYKSPKPRAKTFALSEVRLA